MNPALAGPPALSGSMLSDLQDSTTLRFPYLSDLHNHHDLKDSIIQSP